MEDSKEDSNSDEQNEENEYDENNQQDKNEQLNLNEEIIKLNDKVNNILLDDNTNKEDAQLNENISLLNIDFEKKKNNKEQEENINKINIEKEDENEEEEEDQDNSDLFKCNKEYTDNDDDLHSRRITVKNNNDDYLIQQDENEKDVLGEYKNDDDEENEEEEEENLFPFKIVGNGKKKGDTLGKYHSRYFEIDTIKGLFKRYTSAKEYPKNPRGIIEIKNFKLIKKEKLTKEYNDLEITYTVTNKKGKTSDKVEKYRFRHQQCRNKWFDYLLTLWKCYVKGDSMPKITNKILSFIDDRLGIIQEIKRSKKEKKNTNKKEFKIDLKKFKILSLLGVGGFGTVFKVRHILTGKIYAMKVMNKNYIIQKNICIMS